MKKVKKKRQEIINLFKQNKPYDIKVLNGKIKSKENYSKFAFYDRLLKEEFEKNLNYKFQFDTKIHKDYVKILVEFDNKV